MKLGIPKNLLRTVPLLALAVFWSGCGLGFGRKLTFNLSSSSLYGSAPLTAVPNRLAGEHLYAVKCSICHGPLASSQHRGAVINQILAGVKSVPDMGILKNNLTIDEAASISWVLGGGASVPDAQKQAFNCATNRPPGHSEERRLTKHELTNTLQDLLGSTVTGQLSAQLAGVPQDSVVIGYDDIDHGVSNAHLDGYHFLAAGAASLITGTPALLSAAAGACATAAPVPDQCASDFITGFGAKAFRRPLLAAEVSSLLTIYKNAATAVGDSKEGFRSLISYFLMSPHFLYKVEQNPVAAAGDPTNFKLTPYELATRLSYLIWGTMPDDALFSRAKDGSLNSETGIIKEVDRLLADGRARAHFRHFYKQWLAPADAMDYSYTTTFLAGISPTGLRDALAQELQDYMDTIVWDQKGSFRDLMTSDQVFPRTAAVASIYQTSQWTDGQPPLHAQPGTHVGLLNRAYFLANGVDQGHPVLRGAFIRRRILCGTLPPPSPAAFAAGTLNPPSPDGSQTSRKLFTVKTQPAQCLRCHNLINDLGFSLASFDSLGRFQTQEKIFDSNGNLLGSQPVDASSNVSVDQPQVVPVRNSADLAQALGSSPTASACFATQWYQYAMGRQEEDNDGCSMAQAHGAMTGPGGSVVQMIRATALSPAFRTRKVRQ